MLTFLMQLQFPTRNRRGIRIRNNFLGRFSCPPATELTLFIRAYSSPLSLGDRKLYTRFVHKRSSIESAHFFAFYEEVDAAPFI